MYLIQFGRCDDWMVTKLCVVNGGSFIYQIEMLTMQLYALEVRQYAQIINNNNYVCLDNTIVNARQFLSDNSKTNNWIHTFQK